MLERGLGLRCPVDQIMIKGYKYCDILSKIQENSIDYLRAPVSIIENSPKEGRLFFSQFCLFSIDRHPPLTTPKS